MISTFKVEGFKSLIETSVELGAFNVFIGANGSGKSNLLEAIGVMGAASFGSVEPETLRYRGVRPGLPALYKTSLRTSVSGPSSRSPPPLET
jgi:predicted ATPase